MLFDPEVVPGLHAALCDLDACVTIAHAAAYAEAATDAVHFLNGLMMDVRWLRSRVEAGDRFLGS